MSLEKKIQKKINYLFSNSEKLGQSNCIGTAMFVKGLNLRDSRVNFSYLDFLENNNLFESTKPLVGSFFLCIDNQKVCDYMYASALNSMSYNEFGEKLTDNNLIEKKQSLIKKELYAPSIVHAGVVVNSENLRIFHRAGVNGKLYVEDINSERLLNYAYNCDIKYCM